MKTTDITGTDIRNASKSHTDTEAQIGIKQRAVEGSVDGLLAANAGDLMTRLDQIQNEWSQDLIQMRGKLSEMADCMLRAAGDFEGQDADAGAGMPRG